MNTNNDYLSAIRGFALDLIDGELTEQDTARLEMIVSTLAQIRADGAPDYPIVQYVKARYDAQKDNYGQTVIYLGDAPECPSCGELYEVEVEDGAECLECQSGDDRNEDWIPWS